MNVNDYFKKTYTVAFRLTGDENKAVDLADVAIKRSISGHKIHDKVTNNILKSTAKEVCKIYLFESNENDIFKKIEQNNLKTESFQNALMTLNPLSRTTIVWRDVLGFNISEIVDDEQSEQELYRELNNARRQIKTQVLNNRTAAVL